MYILVVTVLTDSSDMYILVVTVLTDSSDMYLEVFISVCRQLCVISRNSRLKSQCGLQVCKYRRLELATCIYNNADIDI